MNYNIAKYTNYRMLAIGVLIGGIGLLSIISLSGISMYGNSIIMGLYFTGHISFSSASLSLAALGIPSSVITGYLLSTAGYEAFLEGTTVIFIRYAVIDVLGIWGWIILAAIAGTAA